MGSGSKTIWALGNDSFLTDLLAAQRLVASNGSTIKTFNEPRDACLALWNSFQQSSNTPSPDTIIIQACSPITWGYILEVVYISFPETKVIIYNDTPANVMKMILELMSTPPPSLFEIVDAPISYRTVLQRM